MREGAGFELLSGGHGACPLKPEKLGGLLAGLGVSRGLMGYAEPGLAPSPAR
jgi:hypothetical protein